MPANRHLRLPAQIVGAIRLLQSCKTWPFASDSCRVRRLQGFPDNHTLIPTQKRKQLTAEEYAYLRHYRPELTAEQAFRLAADSPRYKAIGNSMAVPVMRWIGSRIQEALRA